jgi:hypothetical protein
VSRNSALRCTSQCLRVLEVCDQGLAETFKVLIRLVDSATFTCVCARYVSDNVGKLLYHRACQYVRHALVLVAYLAPALQSWDPPRLGDPHGIVKCTSEDLRDLIVMQDAVRFDTRGRLLCRVLKTASCRNLTAIPFFCRRYLRSTALCAFSSAAASLKPNLVWSQKFDAIDAKRFLLSDSCRFVASSLSSNHSLTS